ncbi:MAG: hypothetical protein ACOX6A_04215 [Atribacter sp.]|jgi:hypothetical protein|uniref:hypothetical protein n=1 Tax=Atribacter sp. TaxID=2847780 RepID=UPI003D97BFEF
MRNLVLFIFVFSMSANGVAKEAPDIKGLSTAVEAGGLSNLMRFAESSRTPPPAIPSKWHVEHRTKTPEERRLAEAVRDFGFLLVESLEQEERVQRETPADGRLYAQTEGLLDFSDWCMKTPGWGNVVLANHAWMLAANASLRLTSNIDFPIEKCEAITMRLVNDPLAPRMRAAAMNAEANTNLFNIAKVDSDEEMDMACGAGWFLMTFDGKTIPEGFHMPPNKSLNIPVAKANLDFFSEAPLSPDWESPRASWNYRLFTTLRGGSNKYFYQRAQGLLQFRKEIGFFPKKFVRSEEERAALNKDIQTYAAHGIKITPVEEAPSFDPWKEAFRRVWYERGNRKTSEDNHYVYAVSAYKLVISGAFSPLDKRGEE